MNMMVVSSKLKQAKTRHKDILYKSRNVSIKLGIWFRFGKRKALAQERMIIENK